MVFSTLVNMRDRRNTSLSVSSTSSSNSAASSNLPDGFHEKIASADLPPPVTKEHRSRPKLRRSTVARLVLLIGSIVLLLKYLQSNRWTWPGLNEQISGVELVGDDVLPQQPTAVVVADRAGRPRWTVSIPANHSFPLRGYQYSEICKQSESIRSSITQNSRLGGQGRVLGYKGKDRLFIEPAEAENIGALPKHTSSSADDVCERSLTFVLESEHVSFGRTLLMLWLSYSLAKEQGRAFFIDDTRWAYGLYTSFFTPPPSQSCSRPPAHHIVPCPHTSDHLIVSSATAEWTYDHVFQREHKMPRKGMLGKNQRLFDMVRLGYDALFHMVGGDETYAQERVAKLREEAKKHDGAVVGMHIRRGDLHPNEFAYQYSYLPLERYTSSAKRLFRDIRKSAGADMEDLSALQEYIRSPLLLASDDPNVLRSEELAQGAAPFAVSPAQDRLQLATKEALDKIVPAEPQREPGSAYVKHVDENTGWEGGFFSALFKSLGERNHGQHSEDIPAETLRMRELVARGYLLDLSILGQSQGVVCAASSAGCRILGVMMGWDAVKDGRWVNIDDGRPWSWDGSR